MSEETREDFFASAADYITALLEIIRRHVAPGFQPVRALDFGCGVGRVAIPLAGICKETIGMDIAESMLDEARKSAESQKCGNLVFAKVDDNLSALTGTFNFIHSIYVFQHIPRHAGEATVRQLLGMLNEGGVASMQFLISTDLSVLKRCSYWMRVHVPLVKNLLNLLRGKKWSAPMMQLNSYSLNRLIRIFRECGCLQFYMRYTEEGPYKGVILIAQKGAEPGFIDLEDIP